MSLRQKLFALGAVSMAFVAMAFGFQAAGFQPCELCILQRWPHVIAGLAGLAGFLRPHRGWAALGALAMIVSAGLGIYHSGVEWHLWPGPTACTGSGDVTGVSAQDLLNRLMTTDIVRCDEPALKVLGTTMANWNAAASALLSALWARVAVAR